MHDSKLTYPQARSVLLTGATGFLGRFLLTELLESSQSTIYCLVRTQSEQSARARVRDCLIRWKLWRDLYEDRIIALPGDLRRLRLGLSECDYRALVRNVDAIFHCGASVNHLETYEAAKAANVLGTQELLRIAEQDAPKPLHHISTIGIFAADDRAASRTVTEDTSIEHELHRTSDGYAASKWVSEALIMKARERGLPCNIFRLGLLWADSGAGRFDEQQHVYRLLTSCLIAGYGIENYHYDLDPLPVDYAARAIVVLAGRYHLGQKTFHITSATQEPKGLFELCNQMLDTPLPLIPFSDWIMEIKRLHQAGVPLSIVPLIEFAFSMSREELDQYAFRKAMGRVRIDCQRTRKQLREVGLEPPQSYSSLINVCMRAIPSCERVLDPSHSARVA